MANVNGVNFRGAALQQAIGKSPRGSADVERDFFPNIDMKKIERPLELQPATPDKSWRGCNRHRRVVRQQLGRFRRDARAHSYLAGHDRALRLFAARKQTSRDQNAVEPRFLCHRFLTLPHFLLPGSTIESPRCLWLAARQ